MSDDERVFLTPVQAEAMLPEGKRIHTFRNGPMFLVGADWDREDIVQALHDAPEKGIALSGGLASSMGHGLCVYANGYLFVETKAEGSVK